MNEKMENDVSWESFELRFLKVHSELETNLGKKKEGNEDYQRLRAYLSYQMSSLYIPCLFDENISMPCNERGTLDLHTFWQDFVPTRRFTALSIWEDEFGCLFHPSLRVITLFTPLVKVPELRLIGWALLLCHKLASIPCCCCFLEMANQSFRGVYRSRVYVRIVIELSVRVCCKRQRCTVLF